MVTRSTKTILEPMTVMNMRNVLAAAVIHQLAGIDSRIVTELSLSALLQFLILMWWFNSVQWTNRTNQ